MALGPVLTTEEATTGAPAALHITSFVAALAPVCVARPMKVADVDPTVNS